MKNVIEVKNLVKRYRKAKINAVDDVSFTVEEGSFFAFLGPNGAGKTTTISILTTTLSPTSGNVSIAGYDLIKEPSKVRQSIGVIFQNPSLDENLTGEENVRFHSTLYGIFPYRPFFSFMPDEYKDRIDELADVLDIKKEMFKPIKTYSGGMKRKLEIIRSLMHKPKILFLDEPTSGLDPVSRRNLWEYIQKVKTEENTTIFLTTHYLEEAEKADDVGVINNGKIVEEGSPSYLKKKLVKNFITLKSKESDTLKKELEREGFEVSGTTELKVNVEDNNHALQVLRKIKSPIDDLNVHTPTLEEAYFEIIQNSHNAPRS